MPPEMMVSSPRASPLWLILFPCFWLVVEWKILIGGRIRPQRILVFNFLLLLNLPPRAKRQHPPTHSALVLPLLQFIPYCRHQLLVDYCLLQSNSGHLRPRHSPLSIIWCLSFHPPKWVNQWQWAQAQRLATCVWWWGVAAQWFGGTAALPTERERAKPLGVGWQRLMLVVVCCVVLCVVIRATLATILVVTLYQQTQNGWFFARSYHKVGQQTPQI